MELLSHVKALFRRFGVETMWVVLGFVFSSLALLGGTRILTTYLSRAEYGKLALAMSLVNIFSYASAMPLVGGLVRFYSLAAERNELSVLLRKTKQWLFWSSGIIATIAVVVGGLRVSGWGLVACTAVFAVLQMLNQTAAGLEEAARRRSMVALFRTLFEVSRFSLAFLVVALVVDSCEGALAGFGAGALFVVMLHAVYLRHRLFTTEALASGIQTAEGMVRQKFIKYIVPLVITGLCTWPYLMLDRWCLRWFCGIDEVGEYTAVYQIGFVPAALGGNLLVTLISPILFQHIGEGIHHERKDRAFRANFLIASAALVIVLLMAAVLFLLRNVLSRFLLGEAFRAGSWMLAWLFLSGGVYAVAQQVLLRVSGEMQTHKLAMLSCAMVVVASSVYVVGARNFGLHGVLYGAVLVNVVYLCAAIALSLFKEQGTARMNS